MPKGERHLRVVEDSGAARARDEGPNERELQLRADREDFRFLGREFLTWLVYHAAESGGSFGELAIGFGEKMTLRSLGAEVEEVRLSGASPAESQDVRFSVAGGLSIREAELMVVKGDRTFELVLSSDTFDLKRVRLPLELEEGDRTGGRRKALARDEGPDIDAVIEERLGLLDELDRCLASAFEYFLSLRAKPAWSKEVIPAMAEWLRAELDRA